MLDNVVLLKCKYFCPTNLNISDKSLFFNFVTVNLHVALQMIYLTFTYSKKKGKDYNFEKTHKMCFEQVDHFSPHGCPFLPTYVYFLFFQI